MTDNQEQEKWFFFSMVDPTLLVAMERPEVLLARMGIHLANYNR